MNYAIIEFRVEPDGMSGSIKLPKELPQPYQVERYFRPSLEIQGLDLRGVNRDNNKTVIAIVDKSKTKQENITLEDRIREAVKHSALKSSDFEKPYALRGIYATEQVCDQVFTHIICNE